MYYRIKKTRLVMKINWGCGGLSASSVGAFRRGTCRSFLLDQFFPETMFLNRLGTPLVSDGVPGASLSCAFLRLCQAEEGASLPMRYPIVVRPDN